jgi:lipopolysaccharide/colanic/teichoic acid biosynthesis glycosyltransferase
MNAEEPEPVWKRILDVSIIVLSAPFWLPLAAVIAAAVPMVSRGPVLFRQERIGRRGKPFTMLKFRTMAHNADDTVHARHVAELMRSGQPLRKIDTEGDYRVFPLGRFLRSTGLDELPQLFNVLRGEMSLVGPRPCTPYEFERYSQADRQRVKALPGLTGLWQVNGKNKTTFAEMIAMDLEYMQHMSPWRDLVIISKTLPAVVAQAREDRWERRQQERLANAKGDSLPRERLAQG